MGEAHQAGRKDEIMGEAHQAGRTDEKRKSSVRTKNSRSHKNRPKANISAWAEQARVQPPKGKTLLKKVI